MRHVPRTHRVDLDWLIERVREDPAINTTYVNTKLQLADFLTKGQFSAEQWNNLLQLVSLVKISRSRNKENKGRMEEGSTSLGPTVGYPGTRGETGRKDSQTQKCGLGMKQMRQDNRTRHTRPNRRQRMRLRLRPPDFWNFCGRPCGNSPTPASESRECPALLCSNCSDRVGPDRHNKHNEQEHNKNNLTCVAIFAHRNAGTNFQCQNGSNSDLPLRRANTGTSAHELAYPTTASPAPTRHPCLADGSTNPTSGSEVLGCDTRLTASSLQGTAERIQRKEMNASGTIAVGSDARVNVRIGSHDGIEFVIPPSKSAQIGMKLLEERKKLRDFHPNSVLELRTDMKRRNIFTSRNECIP